MQKYIFSPKNFTKHRMVTVAGTATLERTATFETAAILGRTAGLVFDILLLYLFTFVTAASSSPLHTVASGRKYGQSVQRLDQRTLLWRSTADGTEHRFEVLRWSQRKGSLVHAWYHGIM